MENQEEKEWNRTNTLKNDQERRERMNRELLKRLLIEREEQKRQSDAKDTGHDASSKLNFQNVPKAPSSSNNMSLKTPNKIIDQNDTISRIRAKDQLKISNESSWQLRAPRWARTPMNTKVLIHMKRARLKGPFCFVVDFKYHHAVLAFALYLTVSGETGKGRGTDGGRGAGSANNDGDSALVRVAFGIKFT